MDNKVKVIYMNIEITVTNEVADFLEKDKKKMKAQRKKDKRYLSDKQALDDYIELYMFEKPMDILDRIISKLEREKLICIINSLPEDEKRLLIERYFLEKRLWEIAESYGVSKMAISKRLKKIEKYLKSKL
jgi:RNA polymerase sigma factor (sigma-70 family)